MSEKYTAVRVPAELKVRIERLAVRYTDLYEQGRPVVTDPVFQSVAVDRSRLALWVVIEKAVTILERRSQPKRKESQ